MTSHKSNQSALTKSDKNNFIRHPSNQTFTQKEDLPKKRKRYFWKPYGFKPPVINKAATLDRYIAKRLNLCLFPKKNSIRRWSPKGKMWRKFLIKKLHAMQVGEKRMSQPWRDNTWKKVQNKLTRHLKALYGKYDYLVGKKTKPDGHFFKGLKGKFLINACVQYHKNIMGTLRFSKDRYLKKNTKRPQWRKLTRLYRTSLSATQLIHYRKKYVARKFLSNSRYIFCSPYKEYRRHPWKNALMFKHSSYWGGRNTFRRPKMYIKPYLKIKRPYQEKRNQLFKWFEYQLGSKESRRYGKAGRTKQILSKIIFAFYGNVKRKQFGHIVKKTKHVKSNLMGRTDTLLSRLELRLDVLVYRLNLAPSIFWAKQLIEAGKIFILKNVQEDIWCEMHKNTWAVAFPLRLRDPKNLYTKNNWLDNLPINRFKFFLMPTINPNHIVQVGDVLYTAPENKINKFFVTKELFKKPVPHYLMTDSELRLGWHTSLKNPRLTPIAMWQKEEKHPLNSTVLFYPQINDISYSDRVKPSYVNKLMI